MGLTFIASASANGNPIPTITMPPGVQPGDFMFVNVKGRESVSVPREFSVLQLGVTATESTYTHATIAWAICPNPVPATVQFSSGGNNAHASMVVYRGDPGEEYFFDGTASASAANGLDIIPGNITTTRPATVLMCPNANSFDNGQIVIYGGAGWTQRANLAANNRTSTAIFELVVGAGTTTMPTVTLSRTERRGFFAVAVYTAARVGRWTVGTSLSAADATGPTAVIDDKIYMLGGEWVNPSQMRMYDTVTGTYTSKANLPAQSSIASSACSYNGLIYYYRGSTQSFHSYDPVSNIWTNLQSTPFTATTSWLVPDGRGFLWAAGGSGSTANTSLMKYNIAANSWIAPGSNVLNHSFKLAALGADGFIYSFGGYTGSVSSTTVQKLNPDTGVVTTSTVMPGGRHSGAIGTKGQWIIYSAGLPGNVNQVATTHWYFDTETATWTAKTPHPLATQRSWSGSVGNKFFTIAGYDSAGQVTVPVAIWNDPEINGGVLASTGVARASLYAEGYGTGVGSAATLVLDSEVTYGGGVQADSFLDVGSTGSDALDPLFPAEDLFPGPTSYLDLPGTSGNYAWAPDSPELSITGDLDVRARVAFASWTPAGSEILVAKNGSSLDWSWQFYLRAAGTLNLSLTQTGSSGDVVGPASTVSVPGAPGERMWVRVTWRQSDGRIQYFTADGSILDPGPSDWVQLGINRTAAIASIWDSTAPLEVGSRFFGASLVAGADFHRAQVRDNISDDGSGIVFDADFTQVAPTAVRTPSTLTENSVHAATVTINGTAWDWGLSEALYPLGDF